MKHIYLTLCLILPLITFAQQQTVSHTISPNPFEANETVTISFDGKSIDESQWGISNNALYLWTWSYDNNLTGQQDCPSNGTWNSSNEINRLTYNAVSDIYSISITPSAFFGRSNIGRIGFLIKAKDGDGDKKSQDMLSDVGSFRMILNQPTANSTTVIAYNGEVSISAQNSGGNATYILKEKDSATAIHTQANTSTYNYTLSNLTKNASYQLDVTQGVITLSKTFNILVDPQTVIASMPKNYQDGITYLSDTEAVLVLYATGKDFVYVAGSFNNWQPDAAYAMKKDPIRNNKFWIKLTGLTPGKIETYQYWVGDKNPIANSPKLVKTADPYSTLVLSPFDDPDIPSKNYPNLPPYPNGQEREVTVLQTGKTPYNWQVKNFKKPAKEELVVYEVLVRDFDSNRNFQDLIDKIDYFKNLNINAIELMPVMEFEGNESWGYNTSFHMALDKFYGTENKLKEFIDVCHQNGIAVILDVALNHAFGRNPMVRMWMDDPDGDGWGEPSTANPYFNTTPKHTYNVGSDFNHASARTKDYVKRVVKHWIEEFNIDGFRWDLTKGFTQNCNENDENCTNAYQADRVAILKEYADYSWSLDPTHYVIFEHLGSEAEEKEWANYKYDQGKGIMMWGNMNHAYNELTMGYTSDISGIGHKSRPSFKGPRVMGYAESHDEERLMYKNLKYGNSTNSTHDVKDLNTALSRMSALGAVTLTVPGPKMIWHFGELGMQNSIFTCSDGSVNEPGDTNGDCKLSTKPQPQWSENWKSDSYRKEVYQDWARLIYLKTNEPVFKGDYTLTSNSLTPTIEIFDNNLPQDALNKVVVLANFDVSNKTLSSKIPTGETWFDLMDPNGTVTYSNATITLGPGAFKVFGNKSATLNIPSWEKETINVYPNPTSNTFQINTDFEHLSLYDLNGKLVKDYNGKFNPNSNFDISDLAPSLYFLKVRGPDGKTIRMKLIKL